MAIAERRDGEPDPTGSWIARVIRLQPAQDGDSFLAEPAESPGGRLFGGLVAAQALAAACRTVEPSKLPQSLHLYFVRGGAPNVEIVYEVERTRDGRSFDTRRVTARQADAVILEMLASFHAPEPGADLHTPMPPAFDVAAGTRFDMFPMTDRFEIVLPPDSPMMQGPPFWIRSRTPIEPDATTRACALVFLSDVALMAAAKPPGARFPAPGAMGASLDHAVWFHRPFEADRWHWYDATNINNSDSRGLAVAGLYAEDGALVASVVQEALWRLPG